MNILVSNTYAHAAYSAETPASVTEPHVTQLPGDDHPQTDTGMDSFVHTSVPADEAEYAGTTYAKDGRPDGPEPRILPDRYYEQLSTPHVGYKGTMVSYAELLEEAVRTGVVELDENASVFANFERAENALIWSKGRPLYPWSTSIYTEDGQYKLRIENGQVTGARLAYYTDANGRKITTQYLAEQLANGVLPVDLDGSYTFLHDVDPDLYFKALEIGSAKRQCQSALDQFDQGNITRTQLDDEIGPWILLLFGKDGTSLSLARLKEIFSDDAFGSHILQSLGTADYPWPDRTESAH